MDAVFPIRRDPVNDSLRYTLRGLAENVPVDQVWLLGYSPDWVQRHHVIRVPQHRRRHQNISENLLMACRHREISNPFMLWNDDFFALRPPEHLNWCNGTMQEYLDTHPIGEVSSKYRQSCAATLQYLREVDGFENPLSFDLHMPLVVHKRVMEQAIIDTFGTCAAWKRSVYGNRAVRAELLPVPTMRADPKIYDLESVPDESWDWLSTSPKAFEFGAVRRWVEERFPEPSPYEKS